MTRLVEDMSRFGSIAVVGLAKNVGKTVTLNHLIHEAHINNISIGLTSIGVDGEETDRVTATGKPEINIYSGMFFATSETHYKNRRLQSEIMAVGNRHTALGRVVTAKALSDGKTLLSGPSETIGIRNAIEKMRRLGAKTVLVDGAISRLSPASPAITDAMVLATGAALTPDIKKIVANTAFVCSLIALPQTGQIEREKLADRQNKIVGIDIEGVPHDLEVETTLQLEKFKDKIHRYGPTIYVPGMVGDRLLKFLSGRKESANTKLIIRDFTRIFASPTTVREFFMKGGSIEVLKNTRLIGVTVNPWSPYGYTVDKHRLLEEMQGRLSVPVYNVV